MVFFRIFSFLFFVNSFVNSFKFVNHFSSKLNTKLNIYMGCDYYIEHNLCIYYNDNTSNSINLNRERGYYTDYDDFIMSIRDETSGMSEWKKMKQYHLTPKAVPFLIYENHSFVNIYVSDKYKAMLEYEMINHDYKTWDDIKDIVLQEERYERD